jgi:CDGSH-type Zn-finger protein
MGDAVTIEGTESGPYHCPNAKVSGAPGAEVWLCRCGGSQNKPHCDGSHRALGFTDAARWPVGTLGTPSGTELAVEVRPHGPLLVTGAVVVADAAGTVVFCGDRTALCRCGASGNKPFCDGTHKKQGFQAP